MQVPPLLPLITKQLHYFYANQAEKFFNVRYINILVYYQISTYFLSISRPFQTKPIIIIIYSIMLVMFYYVYLRTILR